MVAKSKARKPKDDPVANELGSIKRLLMLQLVKSGVKPVDIALVSGVAKSVISAIIPVRRLSIRKRLGRETLLDIDAKELTKRLDMLVALQRGRRTS